MITRSDTEPRYGRIVPLERSPTTSRTRSVSGLIGGWKPTGGGSRLASGGSNRTDIALDQRCTVRRGLSVRPVARRDTETGDPMNVEAARRAVKNEPTELALKIGLHVQHFKAEHLRLERHGM
jgi:hypothetical protein